MVKIQVFLFSLLFCVNLLQPRSLLGLPCNVISSVFYSSDYGMELKCGLEYGLGVFYEYKFINLIGLRLCTGYAFCTQSVFSTLNCSSQIRNLTNFFVKNLGEKISIWENKAITISLDTRLYPFFSNFCIFAGSSLNIIFGVKSNIVLQRENNNTILKEVINVSKTLEPFDYKFIIIDYRKNAKERIIYPLQLFCHVGFDYTMNCGLYFGCKCPFYIKSYINLGKNFIYKYGNGPFFIVLGFDLSKLI